MEESINSSMSGASFCSKEASSEESSWTTYLEHFMASEEERKVGGSSSCFLSGSSVSSDATSCMAREPPNHRKSTPSEGSKSLRVKKRKGGGLLAEDDDPLEDTASSSLYTPKVRNCMAEKLRKKDDHRNLTKEEDGVKHRNNSEEMRKELVNGSNCFERTSCCTGLKIRGMPLVPLSNLVEYLD